MRLRTSTKIAWNSVFMVLAVAYLFMFYSLGKNPATVNRLGAYLITQHQLPYDQAYMDAITTLETGNTAAAVTTLKSWHDVQKGDRAFSQKRRLLHRLTCVLHEQNRVSELLNWAKKWQASDNRDITARAYYFEALRLSPEFHAEGSEGLALTYLHFPKNQRLAEFYANSLRETGDLAAADEIQKHKVNQQMLNWELFWDTGQGFNATEKSRVDPEPTSTENGHRIRYALPTNTLKFRLDLPASSSLILSNLAIRLNGRAFLIDEGTFSLVMMQYRQGLFISAGDPDPYIIFNLENTPHMEEAALDIEITFTTSSAGQHSGHSQT